MTEMRTAYNGVRVSREQIQIGGGETMVRQAFKDEVDINRIVERYRATGQLPLTNAQARYGDVTDYQDYKTMLDYVHEALRKADDLPENALEQFNANPEDFMRRIDAAESRDDLVALGIVEPKVAEASPAVEPAGGAGDQPGGSAAAGAAAGE